jgi:hypothetical protein
MPEVGFRETYVEHVVGPARLHQPFELLQDLCAYLGRSGCLIDGCYGSEAKVRLSDRISSVQARREVDIYLAVWQALHPGVEAYVLRSDRV